MHACMCTYNNITVIIITLHAHVYVRTYVHMYVYAMYTMI